MFFCSGEEDSEKKLREFGKHLSASDKKILFAQCTDQEDDSNLSFEREMEKEAANHINGQHVPGVLVEPGLRSPPTEVATVDINQPSTSKTKEQENDELFYDPDADDADQKWMDSQRIQYFPTLVTPASDSTDVGVGVDDDRKRMKLEAAAKLRKANSDATLNCACCLTLLCLDCQRHEIYKTQYRAMFVQNCRVDYGRKLYHEAKEEKRKLFRKSKKTTETGNSNSSSSSSSLYYPVHCTSCDTNVAVFDTDEVYHFFSVIASH